ncbi:H(+)-transporting V0 sector ATPase subunit e [Vanrija albida]|uniref:H(+)-transporting V0 sector ATPase subunit e n=1 Tax=Vanrija albida TaxID=181172 RepID=A0ABR3Q575_9TREE
MGFGHVVLIGFIMGAIGVAVWFTTPRGKNQTLIRSSVSLTLACLWLMWGITYTAQLNPLIAPKRADLRPNVGE